MNTMNPMRGAAAVAAAVALLAGCATHVVSLPLQPDAATSATGSAVALYFGSQPHPDVERHLGSVSHSVRVARTTDGQQASCNLALAEALRQLRFDATKKEANAIINITTRFHSTKSDSPTDYTCGVSTSAAAIAVRGDLVVLRADQR